MTRSRPSCCRRPTPSSRPPTGTCAVPPRGEHETASQGFRLILAAALAAEPAAAEFFAGLDKGNRYAVLWRVETASTPQTRAKRIAALVAMLAEGRRPRA